MEGNFAWRAAALAVILAGCATREPPQQPGAITTPVDGVRKVIDALSTEISHRQAAEPFRGLAVVVQPSGSGIEPMVAELLRTRLVERGVGVDHECSLRCMEVALQEFAFDTPRGSKLTPGQVLSFAGGQVPVVGGLFRSLGEQEKEKQRAAHHVRGLLVTFAAREGNRYTARSNVVAITSSSNEVAIEEK